MAIQSDRHDLHFVPSLSAAGSLRKAFDLESANLFYKLDQLSVGPIPPIEPREAWQTARRHYWQRLHHHRHDRSVEALSAGLYDDLDTLEERCRHARHLVIWCSQSLDETVWTAWILATLAALPVDRAKVRLVFAKHPAFPVLPSCGMLSPTDIRDYQDWIELDEAAWTRLCGYYEALSAPTPQALQTYLHAGDEDAWLAEVTLALLDFYPSHGNGLTAIDLRLLTTIHNGVTDFLRIIANQLALKTFHRHALDAAYLDFRLRDLADTRHPRPALHLKTLEKSGRIKVSLSDHGLALLNGKDHFLAENDCDDWVAGTRIKQSADSYWVRRERELETWRRG